MDVHSHASDCDIVIDKEFQSLIPPLAAGELAQLEANIQRDGCREPLVVWSGLLVDGHNRLAICTKHSIKYTTKVIDLPDRNAAKVWMIDNQMGKRNIADIDRIALANMKSDIVGKLAKEKYDKTVGRPSKSSAKLPTISEAKIDTRKELAKSAGVGERTFDAGKMILDAAATGEISQADVQAIRDKEKSIHRVAKDLKEKRQQAKREEQRQKAVDSIPKQSASVIVPIHVGDFRLQTDLVADGSLSLIFTDPPYDRKSSELYDGLGQFAADKLCEGGSLVCYIGHIQMLDALNALSKHLRYWWMVCCLHTGGNSLMREYGVRVGWKPVLWFVKTTRGDKSAIVQDVVTGGKEKSHHDWQQALTEAEYWVEQLCPPDGIVCDPFIGGGTTAIAAKRLNRQWIGFEISDSQAALAKERVLNDKAV